MYNLSRDYSMLFKLLCAGNVALGFVSAPDWCGVGLPKDPCKIYRNAPFDIFIGVRGTGYGSVYPYQKDEGDEEFLFASACKYNDLEWVMPNVQIEALPASGQSLSNAGFDHT